MTIHRREAAMGGRMVGEARRHCLPSLDFRVVRVENLPGFGFTGANCIGVPRSAQYRPCGQQAVLMSVGPSGRLVAGHRVKQDSRG